MERLATYHNRLTLPFDEIQQINVSILKMLTETNKLFIYEPLFILERKKRIKQTNR